MGLTLTQGIFLGATQRAAGSAPPAGFVFLTDDDSENLTDDDGEIMMEEV